MSKDSPIRQSDNWFIGEDRDLRYTVLDASAVAVNISGWTLEWVLREKPWGATALITKTPALTTPGSGICTVSIADDDTINLQPGIYYYTLRRTNAGAETVLAFGDAVLQQASTR